MVCVSPPNDCMMDLLQSIYYIGPSAFNFEWVWVPLKFLFLYERCWRVLYSIGGDISMWVCPSTSNFGLRHEFVASTQWPLEVMALCDVSVVV